MPAVGLILGSNQDKDPAAIRLFRAEPTRMCLVGGLWISRLAVFRVLALGARVAIFTSRPELWQGFGRFAKGDGSDVAILPIDAQLTVTASSLRPILFLYDGEVLAPTKRPDLGPWQTQLTVLRQLTAYAYPAVQESSVIAAQRLNAEEASAAASVLRLTRKTTAWLQQMRDDMLAVISGGVDDYIWLAPTEREHELFGPAGR